MSTFNSFVSSLSAKQFASLQEKMFLAFEKKTFSAEAIDQLPLLWELAKASGSLFKGGFREALDHTEVDLEWSAPFEDFEGGITSISSKKSSKGFIVNLTLVDDKDEVASRKKYEGNKAWEVIRDYFSVQ